MNHYFSPTLRVTQPMIHILSLDFSLQATAILPTTLLTTQIRRAIARLYCQLMSYRWASFPQVPFKRRKRDFNHQSLFDPLCFFFRFNLYNNYLFLRSCLIRITNVSISVYSSQVSSHIPVWLHILYRPMYERRP